MVERMIKPWLKQSPCKRCVNLDPEGFVSICSMVDDMDKFNQSFFGKDFDKLPIIPRKNRVFKNCPSKEY